MPVMLNGSGAGTAGVLLIDGAAPAARNMALDEALLARATRGETALRIYRWERPAVSIGYAQALADIPVEAGREIVRRATGGGAVLHDEDTGFTLALPAGRRADLRALLAAIAGSAAEAIREGGDGARARGGEACGSRHPLCDVRRSPFDVIDGKGRKVAGLAARSRDGALLVQASVRAPSAAGETGAARFGAALAAAIERRFGVRLRPGERTPAERALADSLEADRYATRAWLAKR
ncbi:MAG: lipoate--protein ligase family protein [Planctomycetes bacterium]|nr:lipoate--protein ligase family protein [Planctomycetota bacterium]